MDIVSGTPDPAVVEQYYHCFNERRIGEAAALFTADAHVEFIGAGQDRGGAGYVRFAEQWLAAFPDARLAIERIDPRGPSMCEVHLCARGVHRGVLDVGGCRFNPSGAHAALRLRELLDIRDGRISVSVLSIDLNDLIAQLSTIDYDELGRCASRISTLGQELTRAAVDQERRSDVARRLGVELDAARRALRPHFYR